VGQTGKIIAPELYMPVCISDATLNPDGVRIGTAEIYRQVEQVRIKQQIRANATPRHVPALILQVPDIPRNGSGKISEIAVRDVVNGRPVKNTEALANPQALRVFGTVPG